MVLLALVSQVLSFYSLYISFFSPGISKDQCRQRETFPQDWEYYGVSSGDMFAISVCDCFLLVLKFPEESLEKFLCWMVMLALVSQVLSFYSLHISFFSPGISKDQCRQRETFPQDWEYYGVSSGVSSGDMFVISVCDCFLFVLKFSEESLEVSVLDGFACVGQSGPLIL